MLNFQITAKFYLQARSATSETFPINKFIVLFASRHFGRTVTFGEIVTFGGPLLSEFYGIGNRCFGHVRMY